MSMASNKITSLMNETFGVSGIQSPKHPHVLIFPENKAYPVRNVKNTINPNNNHKVCL